MSSYLSHLPSGLPSSVSGLSNSDLADIQKGDWFPELSHLAKVTAPPDLDANLDHGVRDEGEKIDLFIHTALNPHAPVLVSLGEFLQSKDLTILAGTLQGYASIGRILKNSNLDPNYRHHLENLKWQLTANLDLTHDADFSVKLFKLLCNQAESGTSDLIRWTAANALQQLEYPASLRRQLLHRPPAEIEADILQKYISRLSGRDNPCQDREYIKFWVYGPTEILLSVCTGTYYIPVIKPVLRLSGMRGIRLALQCGNASAVTEAVNFVGEIFNQINPNSTDKRYTDNKTRKKLVSLLLPFINHSDIELRNLIAEKLNDGNNGYQVSDHLLDKSNRAKVAVIDTTSSEKWKRVVDLGDSSIPFLREAIDGKLEFVANENQNTNSQIEALKSIDKIINDIPKKVSTLSQYLSHLKDKIKLETFHLLKNHWQQLDPKSIQLLVRVGVTNLEWTAVTSFGDVSIPVLGEVVEGKLKLDNDETRNTNHQIKALQVIDTILKDISKKVNILSPHLQHDNDVVRLQVAFLLRSHQNHLDSQSAKIITALLFELNLPYESDITSLDRATLESCLQTAKSQKQIVEQTFTNAISACKSSSIATKDYLAKQQNIFLDRIEKYSNSLKICLKNDDKELERIAECRRLTKDKEATEKEIQRLQRSIKKYEQEREQYSNEISPLYTTANQKQGDNFKKLLYGIFIVPFIAYIPLWILSFILVTILIIILPFFGIKIQEINMNKLQGNLHEGCLEIVWVGYIIYYLWAIISTALAKDKKSSIEAKINVIKQEINDLKKQENDLKNQLYAIDKKIKENKCA